MPAALSCLSVTTKQRRSRRRGIWGERLARGWLRLSGFRVVATNWHCRAGELDIVATSPKTLLFVEVKTRVRRGERSPAEAVTIGKRKRIVGSADAFVHRYPALAQGRCLEFSIVEVVMRPLPSIRHLRDAFRPEELVGKY